MATRRQNEPILQVRPESGHRLKCPCRLEAERLQKRCRFLNHGYFSLKREYRYLRQDLLGPRHWSIVECPGREIGRKATMVPPSARRQRRAVAQLVSIKACVAVMLEGPRFHYITSFHGGRKLGQNTS